MRQDPQEVGALFRDLLINVTNFFRDEDAFEALAASVIPKLFEGRGADDTVRIWVPGCATGEEVFSIAMLAREHMERLTAVPRVQIFATDIDERVLAVARAARYPEALLDAVSPERRKRFFVSGGASFVVSKDVRALCIFSPHSVIRDPPFSRIDLVSCRNLLIYLAPTCKTKGGSLEAFSARLGALGRVQSLVGGAMDDHIDLGDIVRLELPAIGARRESLRLRPACRPWLRTCPDLRACPARARDQRRQAWRAQGRTGAADRVLDSTAWRAERRDFGAGLAGKRRCGLDQAIPQGFRA
jgi:chemotaxis methyl-accepting protein methylase